MHVARCAIILREDVSYFQRCPKHHITFHENFTCTDTIVCSKCEKLCIGLTTNSLRVRFCMHRHASETKRRVPLHRHFARKSHDFLRDHKIVPLEHCEPDALWWTMAITRLTPVPAPRTALPPNLLRMPRADPTFRGSDQSGVPTNTLTQRITAPNQATQMVFPHPPRG